MFGYLLGHQAGKGLEELIQIYSKELKSHRRVTETDLFRTSVYDTTVNKYDVFFLYVYSTIILLLLYYHNYYTTTTTILLLLLLYYYYYTTTTILSLKATMSILMVV